MKRQQMEHEASLTPRALETHGCAHPFFTYPNLFHSSEPHLQLLSRSRSASSQSRVDWIAPRLAPPNMSTAGRLPPPFLSLSLPGRLARGDSGGPSSTLASRRLIYSPRPLPPLSAVVAATPNLSKMGG
jgi:hypothetical protein